MSEPTQPTTDAPSPAPAHNAGAHDARTEARRTAFKALGVGVAMLGLSFAAVPAYQLFCQVTGFGGTTQRAEAAPGAAAGDGATVTVLFDANTAAGMALEFRPEERRQVAALGEQMLVFYEAHNPTDRTITSTATFNVAPLDLGGYFAKIQCFCFEEQTLQPGETVRMPVSYFIEPDLRTDPENGDVRTITLSYTLFEVETPEAAPQAAPEETASAPTEASSAVR